MESVSSTADAVHAMSGTEAAWLAGLLEGEGSFRMCRSKSSEVHARVQITSSDRDILERVLTITGAGAIHVSKKENWDVGRRASWQWVAWKEAEVWRVIAAVRPCMDVRRSAQIAALESELLI